ncbi:hypothetical protein AB4K20DRAFT_1912749 [Rhizopus microsporus]
MSLFSKLSKSNEKTLYPWSQKKLGGSNSVLPRVGHAAVAISSDALIIYGGIHRSTRKDLFHIDTNSMSANSISTTGEIPAPRISATILHVNGHVLLYGGKLISSEEHYDPNVYLLNLHSRQWSRLSMDGMIQPTERSGHSCVMHEGIVYLWGGQRNGHYFNDLFIFDVNSAPRWRQVSYDLCPEPRAGHISAIYEGKLYIFGGTNGNRLFNDIWSFDLKSGIWTRIEAAGFIPVAREGCASAMVDDAIYILGGKGENGVELNDLCAYRIKSCRWFNFENMGPAPSPRHGLTMTAVRERLFVLGGENTFSKMEDASLVYILDSTKIKYPAELLVPPSVEEKIHSIDDPGENQYYAQQSYPQSYTQQQPQPYPYPYRQQSQPQQQPQQLQPQQQPQQLQPQSQPQQLQTQPQQLQTQPQQLQPKYQPQYPAEQKLRSGQPSPQQRSPLKATHENGIPNVESQQPSPTTGSPRHRSYYPDPQVNQPPARPPRHMSTVPEAALRRPRAGSSPHPPPDLTELDIRRQYQANLTPTHSPLEQEEEARASPNTPPPRPPREPIRVEEKQKKIEEQPQRLTPSPHSHAAMSMDDEERQMLIRELKARDTIISEMKKKESWWRAEVSLARKLRAKTDTFDDGPDADEALLMDVDHLPEEKVKLFEQLVSVKSELRRVRASILQQAEPMSEKVSQADRMRTAALQEAAYFKSKYLALKSRRLEELSSLDLSRSEELEKRLAAALAENEANSKLLQQLQKRSQHDQSARLATEERAREAQERAEEAQQAHQRALEELQAVYARATKAENQVRENAIKIADLTQQLSEALTAQPVVKSQEVSEAQLKASQLEAANLRARNESAALKQKLAESMDDIARLRTALNEREDALNEARLHIEDYEIQLNMLRDAMNQKSSVNGFAPTPAY